MSSLKEMTKEDLELLSNKEITNLLLEENGKMNTADLYKEIIRLLELPSSTFDAKIGDYYTSLTTDKRFILLEDGLWDLRSRHTSDKAIIPVNDDDEEEDLELDEKEDSDESDEEEDSFEDSDEEEEYDDSDEDLKDLVVLEEDELDLEQ